MFLILQLNHKQISIGIIILNWTQKISLYKLEQQCSSRNLSLAIFQGLYHVISLFIHSFIHSFILFCSQDLHLAMPPQDMEHVNVWLKLYKIKYPRGQCSGSVKYWEYSQLCMLKSVPTTTVLLIEWQHDCKYCHIFIVTQLIIMGSGLDESIYWTYRL
jgi:hypothetical protein